MKNVTGEQGLAPQQLFLNKFYCSFKNSDYIISLVNDGGPKRGYFDSFDMLFPFQAFVKL